MEGRPSLKQALAYEKSQMHRLNRLMTYVITPIYLGASLLIIVAFGILMEIDDEKFLVLGLSLIGFFVLITAVLLAFCPFVKNKVLQDEMADYDFDFSELPSENSYDYSDDDVSIKFDINGMYVDGELFYYNRLYIEMVTNNYCHRIIVAVKFSADDEHYVQIRLDAKTLKMMRDFGIPVQNRDELDYILSNKEKAFNQIYSRGYVKIG